jgi:hypothetical protein
MSIDFIEEGCVYTLPSELTILCVLANKNTGRKITIFESVEDLQNLTYSYLSTHRNKNFPQIFFFVENVTYKHLKLTKIMTKSIFDLDISGPPELWKVICENDKSYWISIGKYEKGFLTKLI